MWSSVAFRLCIMLINHRNKGPLFDRLPTSSNSLIPLVYLSHQIHTTPICCYFHRTEVQSKDASASSVETSFSTPKSSFVRSFSPLQLLSPYLPQNSIITPISCPHIGQRRSYSASEIWTYSVCLPVRRPQVERNSSAVNSSTVARTKFPFSVKCGFFAMARMTGPTFFF